MWSYINKICISKRKGTDRKEDGENNLEAAASLSDTAKKKAVFILQHLSALCHWVVTEGMHVLQAASQLMAHQNVFFSAARERWGQGHIVA